MKWTSAFIRRVSKANLTNAANPQAGYWTRGHDQAFFILKKLTEGHQFGSSRTGGSSWIDLYSQNLEIPFWIFQIKKAVYEFSHRRCPALGSSMGEHSRIMVNSQSPEIFTLPEGERLGSSKKNCMMDVAWIASQKTNWESQTGVKQKVQYKSQEK